MKLANVGRFAPVIIASASVQLKATGQLRRFEIHAYDGGKLPVEGFKVPVVLDLKTLTHRPGYSVIIDHNAKTDHTLGQVNRFANDGRGIVIAGLVTGDHWPVVKNVCVQADKGHIWEASVGAMFDVEEARLIEEGQTIAVNGQDLSGPFVLAMNAVVRETSVLPMGAASTTSVNLAAMAALILKGNAMQTFEEWAASLGVDPATIPEALKAVLMKDYQSMLTAQAETTTEVAAEGATTTEGEKMEEAAAVAAAAKLTVTAGAVTTAGSSAHDPIREMNERSASNYNRIVQIQARCASNPAVVQAAIKNGWDADRAELEMLRQNNRSQAPAGHSKSHETSCTLQALQGAMVLQAGLALDHPSFTGHRAVAMGIPSWLRAGLNDSERNRWMEAAHKYETMSLVDICEEAIRLDNREAPSNRYEMIQAAFSGGNLAAIFTTNVNTQILASYEEADDTTKEWTKDREVANFLENENPRMTAGSRLKKLGTGGTADDMTREAVNEKFKIARYAGKFTVDEQDVINDQFGAIDTQPKDMGLAAAQLRPDLVYAILAENPTLLSTTRALFNVTDGNYTGSAGLDVTKLSAAVARLRLITENGRSLNLQPTHMAVPPSLEDTAINLTSSELLLYKGSTDAEKGSINPHKRRGIKIVSDARLENGVTDPKNDISYGGSASTWYLMCAMAHTILVAYLRGTGKAPQVRQFQLERGQWGYGWDVKMDIGAAPMDWKGIQKMLSGALP